ncbi:MAG: SDR family NAD(P)-dependent oxidoreductase, partial [Opitutales bacterium]
MTNEFSSQTILIGGITGGLGSALAIRLVQAGYTVAGYSRDDGKVGALQEAAPGVQWFSGDAEDAESVENVFAQVEDQVGPVGGYAHCVGSILVKSAHQVSDDEWHGTIRRNLDSAFFALRSAVKRMQRRKAGSLVFVSTGAAFGGLPAHEPIAAAKAGVEGLVRSAAASYASRGLRVNAVAPGMMDTPLAQPIIGSET